MKKKKTLANAIVDDFRPHSPVRLLVTCVVEASLARGLRQKAAAALATLPPKASSWSTQETLSNVC